MLRPKQASRRGLGSLALALILTAAACAPAAPAPAPAPSAPSAPAAAAPTRAPAAPAAPAPTSTPLVQVRPTPTQAAVAPAPTPVAGAKYGGILTVANFDPPSTFDMHQGIRIDTAVPFANVYIGLLRLNPMDDSKIIGLMADSWEVSKDAKVYTFKLNPGIRWHDGKPLTSEDVAWSFNRMAYPPKGVVSPRGEASLQGLIKAEAVDAQTVRMTLGSPRASFLTAVATDWTPVLAKRIVEPKNGKNLEFNEIIGTGPFKFKSYTQDLSVELVKNNDYFVKGRPYLDGITVYIIPDAGTAFAALRTGRVLLGGVGSRAIRPSEARLVESDPDLSQQIEIERYASVTKLEVELNMTRDPFKDTRMREAVNLALDRQAANRVMEIGILAGYINPRTSWGIPISELEKLPGYRQPKDQDIARAKQLVSDAGYAKGLDVELVCRAGEDCEKFAPLVKSDLAKIGLNVRLRPVPANVQDELSAKREHTMLLKRQGAAFDDPDSVMFESYHKDGVRNATGLNDPQINEWIETQTTLTDNQARFDMVMKIQRRLLELNPSPIMTWQDYLRPRWRIVKGFKSGPLFADENLEYAWLDK